MRISKRHFFAEIVPESNFHQSTGFRYLLYDLIGEEETETLVYESHLFRYKANCVARADEHLERVISWENLTSHLLAWAS